jgi:hypothetical protein
VRSIGVVPTIVRRPAGRNPTGLFAFCTRELVIDPRSKPAHEASACIPIARDFSVCRAKNLLIGLVFLERRRSKLAPVRDNPMIPRRSQSHQA